MASNVQLTPTVKLLAIRIALSSGIIMCAAAFYFVRRSQPAPSPELAASNLRFIVPGIAVLLAAILVGLRTRVDSMTPDVRSGVTVVAWGLGEMAALSGLVFYYLTGVERFAAPGLLTFVIGMLLFRARTD